MYHIVTVSTGTIVARFTDRKLATLWLERNNTLPDKITEDADRYRYTETVKPADLFKIVKVD